MQQKQSFTDLTLVFASALLLVTLLLLFLFENIAVAASTISVVLLAVSGVFVGLFVTGTELNISALMGLTMIVGIVTELAIFYFAEIELDHAGQVEQPRAAILLQAGSARLRPILMSALIAILALLPLALGLGGRSGPAETSRHRDHLRPDRRRSAGAAAFARRLS